MLSLDCDDLVSFRAQSPHLLNSVTLQLDVLLSMELYFEVGQQRSLTQYLLEIANMRLVEDSEMQEFQRGQLSMKPHILAPQSKRSSF